MMRHQCHARHAPSDTTPLHSPPHVHSVSLVRTMTTALLRLSVSSAHLGGIQLLARQAPMDVLLVLSVSMTTTVDRATVPRHHAWCVHSAGSSLRRVSSRVTTVRWVGIRTARVRWSARHAQMGHTWTRQATMTWVTASTALLGRLSRLLVAILPVTALAVQLASMLRLPTTIMTTTADRVSQAAMLSP
jgi:hypothetical protein